MPVRTILYLDHTAQLSGGEIALLDLVTALDRRRYRPIVVLASEGPLAEKLRTAGIETHVEPLDAAVLNSRKDSLGLKSLLHLSQICTCLRYVSRLARLARRLGADLIHTNSLKADIYGGLAGRLAGIPVIWHVRDNINAQYLPPRIAAGFRGLSRLIPQGIIANSESTLRTLRPPRRQKTAVVYSGVSLSSWLPASEGTLPLATQNAVPRVSAVGQEDRTPRFAFRALPETTDTSSDPRALGEERRPVLALVGRIAGWKGQHIFIQAAAITLQRFPEARFQIIGAPLFGETDYEQTLHEMVSTLGLTDRIAFLGFCEDVPALLAQVEIVVHASTLGEPFGQVVVQGMAAGKPVIATRGGALPEIVVPGATGLLVPMGDAPAMALAMQQLLENPVGAAAMGAAGRRRVQERFTLNHTVRALEAMYDRFLPPLPVSAEAMVETRNPGYRMDNSGLADEARRLSRLQNEEHSPLRQ